MSSIPAGQWVNPNEDLGVCSWRGCGQRATLICYVIWSADSEYSLELRACLKHEVAAQQSFLQGTNVSTGTGDLQMVIP